MIADIKAAVAGRETEILDKLGIGWRDGQPHIRCPYLAHVDKHPSWRWDSTARRAFCTCSEPGSIFDVIIRVDGCDFRRAADRVAELLGRDDLTRGGKAKAKARRAADPGAATFAGCRLADYAAAKGLPEDFLRLLGLADISFAHKPAIKIPYHASGGSEAAIRFRVGLDGADRFRWAKGSKALLYGLDRLRDAREAGFLVIVEGESDAQTLWLHGFPGVGLPGAPNWNEDRDAHLLDDIATVFVVIEPDKGGAAVLKWLSRSSIRPRAHLVRLRGAKDTNALYLADPGGFKAAFQRELDTAEPCPEPEKKAKDDDTRAGRALALHEPEPWPDAVDGALVLDELVRGLRRHVVLGQAEVEAVALWCLATHAFDRFSIYPRLLATSPEKRCGKSTLLDAIERLVPRALAASNITPAGLYRVIEAIRPTLILDEADSFARDNEDLRGVLNAGHKRNGMIVRVVERQGDYEARQFSVYAPVVLAAIGHLPGTIEDRSIIIRLKRRRPDEHVESLRLDKPNGLDELARKAARWVVDHGDAIGDADPAMPPEVFNRAADNWRPLLAVADIAGGQWPEYARRAASELGRDSDDESRRVQLLCDVNAAFEAENTDRLSSDEIVARLIALDDRPWVEFRNGRPLSKPQLARLLKPLGVSSGTIRLKDGSTPKGYYRAAFDDAFARYLPDPPLSKRHTATSQAEPSDSADSKTPQANGCGVSESPGEPCVSAGCGGVAVSKAGDDEDPWSETL